MAEITLELAAARYVSLETFRRSGIAVAPPVWIARSGSRYYVFSDGAAGQDRTVAQQFACTLGELRYARRGLRCLDRVDGAGN